MRDLFRRRRKKFRGELVGYARYVFNDHFVLFLFLLLGLALTQYREILVEPRPYQVGLAWFVPVFSLFAFWPMRMATYMRRGDEYFLLVQEEAVKQWLQLVYRRTSKSQILRAVLIFAAFLPLWWVAYGSWWPALVAFGLGALLQQILLQRRYRVLRQAGPVDWTFWIEEEQGRTQGILRFFSLFTQVKGIEERVRMRAYWNPFLPILERGQSNPWYSLFLRSFLRKGPYYGVWLRLQILALLALIFVPQGWLAAGLAFVANYLLYFQLLALFHSQNGQVMTELFPYGVASKAAGLRRLLQFQLGTFSLLLSLLVLLSRGAFLEAGIFLLAMIALLWLYIPYKLRGLVDADV
ncbi:ABC transporter permease [Streptococcus sp. 121]|uniref:ABC transporter permease n=1 Tax=Streptococcus sp. 121 TaxID=2797637 RepID=UPI0018F0FABD|nr:ABC transporter permease [Streptococcus sp. 121]MBJ6746060.1 ABC transporter permease [Streptococcus sp. 121]